MSERMCGALGCTNTADGTEEHGGVTVHTCLDCANRRNLTVSLYE